MKFIRKFFGNTENTKIIPKQAKVIYEYQAPKELVDKVFVNHTFPNDLYSLNKFIFGSFFYQSAPFILWKDSTVDLPDNLEVVTKISCQFLILRYWFWFLTSNYGSIVSNMLRDEFDNFVTELENIEPKEDINFLENIEYYFTQIDESLKIFNEIPESKKSIKTADGDTLVLPWEYYLALKVLITSVDSPYYKVEGTDFDGNDNLVMGCLGYSKFIAEATFNKFKEHLGEFDARTLKTWKWKKYAGLYEQQLKRKHNSIFFNEADRVVSAYDVYVSRLKDSGIWRALYDRYLKLKKEILDDESPNNALTFIMKKREELDELIDEVDMLGVGKQGLDIELSRLREALIDIWKYIYKESNNTKGLDLLENAENVHKNNSGKNKPDFINLMGHETITDDTIFSNFLSLSINEIKEVIFYLESQPDLRDVLIHMRTGSLRLVNEKLTEIDNLEEVKDKLNVIGVAI